MTNPQSIFALADAPDATAIPLSLEGYPTKDSEGNPIHYRRMLVAPFGAWVHRGTGEPLPLTASRADEWIKNVAALAASGIKPYVSTKHPYDAFGNFIQPDARDTLGYVERMERDEKALYSVVALHGDESLKVASKNSRSIGVSKSDVRDATGNVYAGETLHHLAIVPNPVLPNLGGTQQIAASADTGRDVPVFVLALQSAPSRERFDMKTELATQVRAKLGIGADVPDNLLADKTAEIALSLSADLATEKGKIITLTTERDAAKAEATAKASQVLALSADATTTDPMALSLIGRAFKTEEEQVIKAGRLSQAGIDEMRKLFMDNGKPTRVALSLSAGSADPLYLRVLEIYKRFPGLQHDNGVPRGATVAEPVVAASADGSDSAADKAKLDAEVAELRKQHHLPATAGAR